MKTLFTIMLALAFVGCEKEYIEPEDRCPKIVVIKYLAYGNNTANTVRYTASDCTGSSSFDAHIDAWDVGDTIPR